MHSMRLQIFHKCVVLREMTASRDALELELKHNEKEFASLVTEELEQRFARFEDITLAAVSKMGPSIAASSGAPASAPYRTPTGQPSCHASAVLMSICQHVQTSRPLLHISTTPSMKLGGNPRDLVCHHLHSSLGLHSWVATGKLCWHRACHMGSVPNLYRPVSFTWSPVVGYIV